MTRCVWTGNWREHVTVSSGEGLVPEQENEVETCERRPAGGGSSAERTGEREKRDLITVRVFRDGGAATFSEFAEDHRGWQSGQRPQRGLWPNMDQSTKTIVSNTQPKETPRRSGTLETVEDCCQTSENNQPNELGFDLSNLSKGLCSLWTPQSMFVCMTLYMYGITTRVYLPLSIRAFILSTNKWEKQKNKPFDAWKNMWHLTGERSRSTC